MLIFSSINSTNQPIGISLKSRNRSKPESVAKDAWPIHYHLHYDVFKRGACVILIGSTYVLGQAHNRQRSP